MLMVVWTIWWARNNMTFSSKAINADEVVDQTKGISWK